MARTPDPPQQPRRSRLPQSRWGLIGLGALLGAGWGVVMWAITSLAGQESGARGLIYLALTMAMIGTGVAALFGAVIVQRRGERVAPRLRRRR